ncbi:hypothetical protein [Mesorhizobium sp. WSM2239]|uniref:Uncharacterized protein n=2 Tax=unclassified Mesorhizobium TaxID=325217 RepID=A0AAU8DCB1_9HYPH
MANRKSKAVAKPYEPTPLERKAVASYKSREKKVAPLPAFVATTTDGSVRLDLDHPDLMTGYTLVAEAIKSNSLDYFTGCTSALASVCQKGGQVDAPTLNYAVAMVAGIEPRDQLESMLATQMAAVHLATMDTARRMATSGDLARYEAFDRSFNKLARTFAAQIEALKRYRSKGVQRVIVERVTVEKGGQAIVGNVTHGGGVDEENAR